MSTTEVVDNGFIVCNNELMGTNANTTDTTTPTRELEMGTLISTGTKTGTKVHASYTGSSSTICGHWMKHNAAASRKYTQPNCSRCLETLNNHGGFAR